MVEVDLVGKTSASHVEGEGEGEGEGTTIITTEEGVEEGAGPATGGTEVCDHTPWRLRT